MSQVRTPQARIEETTQHPHHPKYIPATHLTTPPLSHQHHCPRICKQREKSLPSITSVATLEALKAPHVQTQVTGSPPSCQPPHCRAHWQPPRSETDESCHTGHTTSHQAYACQPTLAKWPGAGTHCRLHVVVCSRCRVFAPWGRSTKWIGVDYESIRACKQTFQHPSFTGT